MSFASQTWTIDSTGPYARWIFPDGTETTLVDDAQTLTFTGTDTGDGGVYTARTASTLSMADGSKIKLELDPNRILFKSEANGATINNGSIWVTDDDNNRYEINVVAMTVTDGDAVGANNLASITFEYPGKPYRWTWTNVNTA